MTGAGESALARFTGVDFALGGTAGKWAGVVDARRRGDAEGWSTRLTTFFDEGDGAEKVLALLDASIMVQRTGNPFRARVCQSEAPFAPLAEPLFQRFMTEIAESHPDYAARLHEEVPVPFASRDHAEALVSLTCLWDYTDQLAMDQLENPDVAEMMESQIQELAAGLRRRKINADDPQPAG